MSKFEGVFGNKSGGNAQKNFESRLSEADRFRRRVERERSARHEAERLLEEKSKELYELNVSLKELNNDLEKIVRKRTEELRKSIERVEEQQRLAEHMARHDALTDLPNRRYLTERLNGPEEEWRKSSLLYIDLDRFKQINDTLGHAAGDALLVEVANRLKSYSPDSAYVARIGGDEFVIVLPTGESPEVAQELAELVVERLPEPILFEGNTLRFGTSVGVAHCHVKHESFEDLMIEADLALYRAKEGGRGCAVPFSEEMRELSTYRKQLSDDLIEAMADNQIRPVYQPRVCAKTGRILCVEALARWYHPTRGTIAPADFLSIAEDIGRLAEIDELILQAAIKDLAYWDSRGVFVPRVSVNVSGRRLLQPDLSRRLDALDIPRGRVSFELLESVFFDNADDGTLTRLEAIRARDIRIEIDDFGSGHASINGLLAIKPDALKIDRQLVAAALGDDQLTQLLHAVTTIGSALSIEVVAEGVETDTQFEMCRELGCHQIQGYGILRPAQSDELLEFAKSKQDCAA